MKRKTAGRYEILLDSAAVDEISARVREYLEGEKWPRKETLRYSLMIEEILLECMDRGLKKAPVRLLTGTRFLCPYIVLEIEGEPVNVFLHRESRQTHFGSQILQNLGASPEYNFSGNTNTYRFHLHGKRLNPFLSLVIALSSAATVGFSGLLLESDLRSRLLDSILTPLYDAFLNMLGCIAGPMIFLAVAWGIYGIGDVATLKRVGKKVLAGYIGTVAAAVAVIGAAMVPLFSLTFSGSSGGSSELSSLFTMLLGIIPRNIFSPFVDGNTLQVIFLAVVIGISLIFLGHRTNAVARAIEQINYIVQFLIEFISRLVPYFIFIVVVRMIWSDMVSDFAELGKLFSVFIAGTVLMSIGVVAITAIKNQVNPLLLVRKGIPTFLIAVTTASSAAAFGTNVEACRKRYGIDETVSSFGIPLALATFKPTTALNYVTIMLFFAEMYHVDVSLPWIVFALLVCAILAIATPPHSRWGYGSLYSHTHSTGDPNGGIGHCLDLRCGV